jgi:hypothetical protein
MKTLFSFCVALAIGAGSAWADQVVEAGTITSYSPETGQLVLQPDSRAGNPLVFQNMNKAPVMLASGEMLAAETLRAGQMVTVHYAPTTAGWRLSRVVVGATVVPSAPTLVRPSPGAAPVIVQGAAAPVPVENTGVVTPVVPGAPAIQPNALRDGDITTQPGSKAAIDRDITTQPGSKAATDRDITTQPGNK